MRAHKLGQMRLFQLERICRIEVDIKQLWS